MPLNLHLNTDKDDAIKNQRILEHFVDKEVICNISGIVDHFLKNPEMISNGEVDWDEIFELSRAIDWEEAVDSFVDDCTKADIETLAKDKLEIMDMWEEMENTNQIEETREKVRREILNLPIDEVKEILREAPMMEWDEHTREVLEFWIVTPGMADDLEQKGESVMHDFFGHHVWGRTTSGQSIILDNVIRQIGKELGII